MACIQNSICIVVTFKEMRLIVKYNSLSPNTNVLLGLEIRLNNQTISLRNSLKLQSITLSQQAGIAFYQHICYCTSFLQSSIFEPEGATNVLKRGSCIPVDLLEEEVGRACKPWSGGGVFFVSLFPPLKLLFVWFFYVIWNLQISK